MTKIYMITAPRRRTEKEFVGIMKWLRDIDSHKWVVAAEVGRGGYEHWQVRVACSLKFDRVRADWGGVAHVEEASDTWEYERKGGLYWTSEDNAEIRKQRFGKLRPEQRMALDCLESTSDREILVWVTSEGNVGKSWLCGALYERGLALIVPPTIDTVKGMMQWVASGYKGEPYIVIDIPRSWKWNKELYTAIESIKDGLVYDTRYSAKMRNIRGVKIMCLTNESPKLDKLSIDRWVFYDSHMCWSEGGVRATLT